MLYSEISNYN